MRFSSTLSKFLLMVYLISLLPYKTYQREEISKRPISLKQDIKSFKSSINPFYTKLKRREVLYQITYPNLEGKDFPPGKNPPPTFDKLTFTYEHRLSSTNPKIKYKILPQSLFEIPSEIISPFDTIYFKNKIVIVAHLQCRFSTESAQLSKICVSSIRYGASGSKIIGQVEIWTISKDKKNVPLSVEKLKLILVLEKSRLLPVSNFIVRLKNKIHLFSMISYLPFSIKNSIKLISSRFTGGENLFNSIQYFGQLNNPQEKYISFMGIYPQIFDVPTFRGNLVKNKAFKKFFEQKKRLIFDQTRIALVGYDGQFIAVANFLERVPENANDYHCFVTVFKNPIHPSYLNKTDILLGEILIRESNFISSRIVNIPQSSHFILLILLDYKYEDINGKIYKEDYRICYFFIKVDDFEVKITSQGNIKMDKIIEGK